MGANDQRNQPPPGGGQAAGCRALALFNKTNVYNDDYLALIRDFTH